MTPEEPLLEVPTLGRCWLRNEEDAWIVARACLDGRLHFLERRRPGRHPESELFKSGGLVAWRETIRKGSKVSRWIDPYSWSPSRKAGEGMLYYAQRRGPNCRATRRRGQSVQQKAKRQSNSDWKDSTSKSVLVHYGSLIDTYNLVANGLIKKTWKYPKDPKDGDTVLRIVNYFFPWEVATGHILRPMELESLQKVHRLPTSWRMILSFDPCAQSIGSESSSPEQEVKISPFPLESKLTQEHRHPMTKHPDSCLLLTLSRFASKSVQILFQSTKYLSHITMEISTILFLNMSW